MFILQIFVIFAYFEGYAGEDIRPRLIHISLGNDESSLIIMWSTKTKVGCLVDYDNNYDFLYSASGNVSKLIEDSDKALRYLHRAELVGLQGNRTYFYRVNCELEGNISKSETYTFRTRLIEEDYPIKLLVYGDMGSVSGQQTVPALQEELLKDQFHSVLHVGDFGYDLNSNGGATGDEFLELIQPIATQYPYMTSPGNHELGSDLHHYRYRFSMPGTEWPMPLDKLWYSFDIGPVHFISFSTEVYFIHNQDYTCLQYDWLLEDLRKANHKREKTPWIIAMGHRPMYCSNNNLDDCTPHFWGQWVKRGLEDLFYGMGVDLVLEAHEHSYERLWPVYRSDVVQHSYVNPRAPVHLISGAGGNGEGVDWMGYSNTWSAFRADRRSKNSYGRLSIVNKTHLHFDQVSAITKDVLDQIWIVQENHGPFMKNIDCDNYESTPSICSCPPPFHYITWLIVGCLGLVSTMATCIAMCCYSCKCCGCCRIGLRTCTEYTNSSRGYSFSRLPWRHKSLVDTDNTDTDEEMSSYWSSYTIDQAATDTELILL